MKHIMDKEEYDKIMNDDEGVNQMTGSEINFVVKDSVKTLELYKKIFTDIEVVEATAFEAGKNEAVFNLYNGRFHMLDENPDFELVAPREGHRNTIWFNILVADIKSTFDRAIQNGCTQIQDVKHMPEMGASNALFADPFGYVWLLHEIHQVVSFEDRVDALKQ